MASVVGLAVAVPDLVLARVSAVSAAELKAKGNQNSGPRLATVGSHVSTQTDLLVFPPTTRSIPRTKRRQLSSKQTQRHTGL